MDTSNLYNVIIDTNVIVSAILSKDTTSPTVKVLELLFNNRLNLFYSKEILKEYIDVLSREKFKFEKELIDYVIQAIVEKGNLINPDRIEIDLIDIKDKPFYELVMDKKINTGKLITGNLKHFPSQINIVTPRQFIDMYERLIIVSNIAE